LNYYIIIPAHNEADFISLTLDSIVSQTILPKKVVVVNDNSTDDTAKIIENYTNKHLFINTIDNLSGTTHLPGSKVIQAFYKGYETLDDNYDFIVKLDADIILPKNYFETLTRHFNSDKTIGMVGGFAISKKTINGY